MPSSNPRSPDLHRRGRHRPDRNPIARRSRPRSTPYRRWLVSPCPEHRLSWLRLRRPSRLENSKRSCRPVDDTSRRCREEQVRVIAHQRQRRRHVVGPRRRYPRSASLPTAFRCVSRRRPRCTWRCESAHRGEGHAEALRPWKLCHDHSCRVRVEQASPIAGWMTLWLGKTLSRTVRLRMKIGRGELDRRRIVVTLIVAVVVVHSSSCGTKPTRASTRRSSPSRTMRFV